MNTIDQRILIPTPPEVVWDYLGDLTKIPEWQADSKAVSFLTSKRNGPGTRLRVSSDKGQDRVVEVTAWYDGLGYQYTYVDGVPYRESTGRIRLQEIPEGTVVQWTFTYEVGGLRIGLGRQIEAAMETSLKQLWKQVSQSSGAQKIREAKSLMRDAPDYEARAQYKPRHPSATDAKPEDEFAPLSDKFALTEPISPVPSAPPSRPEPVESLRGPMIDEPPFSEDDTRPRRPVSAAPAAMPDELFETTDEPDFLFRPPQTQSQSQSQSAGLPDELFETTSEPDFLGEHARFAPPTPAVEPMADTQPVKPITAADLGEGKVPDELEDAAVDDLFAPRAPESITDEPPVLSFSPVIIEPVAESIHAPETDLSAIDARTEPAMIDQPEDLTDEPAQEATLPVSPLEAQTQPVTPEPPRPIVSEQKPDITPPTKMRSRDEISKLDTATMSIWEIFGVQRPSDQPAEPPAPEPAPASEPVTDEVAAAPVMSDVPVIDDSEFVAPVETAQTDATDVAAPEMTAPASAEARAPEAAEPVVAEASAPEASQPIVTEAAAPDVPTPVTVDAFAAKTPESVSTVVLPSPAVETAAPTVHTIRAYDLPPENGSHRGGLRMRMRRKTVRLRYPD